MKVICCNCGIEITDKHSNLEDNKIVSHGLCKKCARHFIAQVGVPLNEYIEDIPVPVVTVNSKGHITAANKQTLNMLGKSSEDIFNETGGTVFECQYASLPEGCGNTVHCSACTIRNTVMNTMKTGEPYENVQAFLNEKTSNEMVLLISTEKKGGVVFLKVIDLNKEIVDE